MSQTKFHIHTELQEKYVWNLRMYSKTWL
jgi:hypothetical protein